jgi:hypothetical protein
MSTSNAQAGRKRVVHQLDTPFSTVSWYDIFKYLVDEG